MSNQNKLRKLENRKNELIRNIRLCENYKKRIVRFVHELNDQYNQGLINYEQHYDKLNRILEQRTPKQWIKYYNDYIEYYNYHLDNCERDIRREERKTKVVPIVITLAILMIFGVGLFFLKPTITGLVVGPGEEIYTQNLSLIINESSSYEWQLEHSGILKSTKISGRILGNGTIKVYLDDKLVLDSSKLEKSGISMITGLAISDLAETNESAVLSENITEEIANITAPEILETENITNITQEVPENITIPEETEANITIPEEINVSENITMPEENITEPVIENITQPIEIEEILFNDICIETCSLDLNKTSYDLRFEIENAVLYLDNISYTIKPTEIPEVPKAVENISKVEETTQGQAEINKPVKWTKKITLNETVSNLTVNLPQNISNISVNKIKDKIKEEISPDKLKIREDKQLKPISMITGYAVKITEEVEEETELVIEESVKEVEIEYYTEAPEVTEKEINAHKKQIIVSSDVHYTNITAYTNITESPKDSIKLYRTTGGIEELTEITNYTDTNDNGLIDKIYWIVPHLSNESYEVEITILNVQSYPAVGGNWTVMFNTSSIADLRITAINGTSWSNTNEDNDLKLLEIKCGNEILNYYWINNSVLISNYSCENETGFETSKVLTPGKHHLEFDFGGIKAYAHNWAGNPPSITWEPPTPPDGNTTENDWVYLNTTITDDNETSAFFDWDNSLLAYWNFEDITTDGTVYDNSTYGYDGNLYNHATNTTVTGKFGDALAFDGVDDYIKIEDVMVTNPSELTIAAWIKKEDRGSGTYEVALHQASNSNIGTSSYFIGVESNDNLLATIGANSGAPSTWEAGRITPNTPAVYGQWYHLAAVWDGSVVRVYLDGEWNKQYDLASYTPWTTPTRIGASNDGTTYQFGGDVDEVLILERALSVEEIGALYNNTANRLYHNFTDLSPGLYNYSAYVIDEDGNLNISQERNVTIAVSGPPTIPSPSLNSTDGSDLDTQDLNCYDTITDPSTDSMNVTVKWYKDDVLNLTIDYNNTYPNNYGFNAVLDSGNTSSGDVWKCGMRLYDGAEYSEWGNSSDLTIIDQDPPAIDWGPQTPVDDSSQSGTSVYLNTTITDMVDTSAFFDWNYSLLGYWSIDFYNSTGIFDNSTYNNFGVFTGGGVGEEDIVSGKYGQAMDFGGATGNVKIAGDPFNDAYTQLSLSYWFKTHADTSTIWQTAVHRNDGTSVGSSTWFGGLEVTSNQIACTIGANSGAPSTYKAGYTGVTAVANTWYYVVASWNGTLVTVYVDGVEKKNYALLALTNKAATMRIGSSGDDNGYMFNGVVDEVKLFERALSPEEINASYNNGLYKLYRNFTDLSLGTYNYSAYAIDTGGNLNITELRSVTIQEPDNEYPIFSNYWDDNATLEESGTGHFNITVENTNGTVLLEINGTNVKATNLTLNVYNVSYDFITNDTYTYRWHSWGNGTLENYNVSDDRSYVVNASANQPPTITDISDIPDQSIAEAGISYVEFSVLASDENGVDDLNDTSLNATFSKSGETTRTNSSCSLVEDLDSDTANYTCTIKIWYWDGNGDWTINASIEDINEEYAENTSTTFTLSQTTAMTMAPTALTWSSMILTSTNQLSNDNILINNTANKDITDGNVKVTAIDMQGETTTTEYLLAGNFTVNTANACDAGEIMVNGTATGVSGATITAGNNSAGAGQEQLYFCLEEISSGISQQAYSTTGAGAWTVGVS